jgi:uncharacterized protein
MRHLSRTAVAIAVGSVISMGAQAELLITEYVEGGSFNKAIEIYNNSETESVDLTGYKLARYKDGSTTADTTNASLTGSLGAGQVMLVVNSGFDEALLPEGVTTLKDNGINFNGGDAVGLLLNDVLVDVVGDIPTKSGWGKDVTLQRNTDNLVPSTSFDASQWTSFSKDTVDGLGSVEAAEPAPVFECKTEDGSEPTFTSINDIQGSGETSPFINGYPYVTEEDFFVKGVVTARGESLTKGFYLQALAADGDDSTSDGLFIHTDAVPSDDIQPGVEVCVKGKVQEYYNLTRLASDNNSYVVTATGGAAPEPQPLEMKEGETLRDTLERFEGMLVETTPGLDLRVSRTFGYDYSGRRNNMVVAQGRPNMQPNQLFAAGSDEATAQHDENVQSRLYIESDLKAGDGEVPYYEDFAKDNDQDGSADEYIRINDRIDGVEGVISYSYDEYRLVVTNQLAGENFVHLDDRTEKPALKDGDLRVATFNVLNYFYSPHGGDANSFGDNRGAETQEEFVIQEAKIVSAIVSLDADIVGLMEIENNGFGEGSAIQKLVTAVNSKIEDESDHYTFVTIDSNDDGKVDESDSVGTDSITVGVIYRSNKVTLEETRIIKMPMQDAPEVLDDDSKVIEDGKNYQRDSITPTFKVNGTEELLTVAVNHLKSKGSKCWEDAAPEADGGQGGNDADYQGSCENFRVAGAVALGDALKEISGDKLIVGDMNSYGMEDPMLVLTDYTKEKYGKDIKAARNTKFINADGSTTDQFGDSGEVISHNYGYINVVAKVHPDSWSYSYNDEVGALDHILASDGLEDKIVDAMDWHINGGESTLFDYETKYKGDLPSYNDQYRASDHDPAIVVLKYQDKTTVVAPGEAAIVEYQLPSNAVVGDLLTVTLEATTQSKSAFSSSDALSQTVELTEEHITEGFVSVDFGMLESSTYTVTKTLKDADGNVKAQETETLNVESTATPSNNGGSFGFGALLALAGLGWSRRRRT